MIAADAERKKYGPQDDGNVAAEPVITSVGSAIPPRTSAWITSGEAHPCEGDDAASDGPMFSTSQSLASHAHSLLNDR